MSGIREQIKISHCVILCIILGCSLRFVGLTRGDSSFVLDKASQSERAFYHFHPDETALIQAALDPIDPLSPKITSYGMLPIYLLRGVLEFNSTILRQDFTNQKSPDRVRYVYFIARTLAVLASCLTLYLVWLLGNRWFNELTGLLAVCIVAVAPIAIQLAHFYTVDGLFTLLILATMYVLLRALERPDWRWFVLTGILIGLSAAVRLIGLSAGFILYIVLAYRLYERQEKEEASKVFLFSTQIHPLPMAYNFLANIAVERKDYKQAAEYFEQSLQLDNKQADAHATIGKITARFLNDQPKALYHFQRALELDPKLEADLSGWVKLKENQ